MIRHADITGDFRVDWQDLEAVRRRYGSTAGGRADVDRSGRVDFADLLAVAQTLGRAVPFTLWSWIQGPHGGITAAGTEPAEMVTTLTPADLSELDVRRLICCNVAENEAAAGHWSEVREIVAETAARLPPDAWAGVYGLFPMRYPEAAAMLSLGIDSAPEVRLWRAANDSLARIFAPLRVLIPSVYQFSADGSHVGPDRAYHYARGMTLEAARFGRRALVPAIMPRYHVAADAGLPGRLVPMQQLRNALRGMRDGGAGGALIFDDRPDGLPHVQVLAAATAAA